MSRRAVPGLRPFAAATTAAMLMLVATPALAANAISPESANGARAAQAAVIHSMDLALVEETVGFAATLDRLHALIVTHYGEPVVERVFRGPSLDRTVNVKSAAKTVISALVGIAIEKGVLAGVNQPILPLLETRAPQELDPRVSAITLDHLLSMRAGLQRTSGGENYGPWVVSSNWVRYALSRPFDDAPGGTMLYSTGNTHMLSAILTDKSGRSTLQLAREWLGEPLDSEIPPWTRDPQGIYFGGNEMGLSPRFLLRFGEMYRNGGAYAGRQIVSPEWIRQSWRPRTIARSGDLYGYGWFITAAHGHPIYYAWGFGGQMLYVVPTLGLTIVMTSDPTTRSAEDGHRNALHALVKEGFVPAAMNRNLPLVEMPHLAPRFTDELFEISASEESESLGP